ncbi:hypothetical protein [Caldisericum exile]|uniref:Uncharacterized protein n=1 Tax=Caldisericum exile (strain DSM 21853 / NBRC 104410 / AZM16c01) TaxID=511051 RepID=A0A7U6JG72_CALEA|nr:hypothetical protein [Caldisericum exile]BAL81095.1 hypothetical protein CSE_09690 [Caldisericum exile AZM16c01]
MWNTEKHTKAENKAYIDGRSGEWANLPIYVTEILVPPLMGFIKWYILIVVIYILNLLWGFVSDKFINLKISYILWQINKFRWIVFIVSGYYYISKSMYIEGALSLLWPFISLILAFLNFYNKQKDIKAKIEEILYNKEQN